MLKKIKNKIIAVSIVLVCIWLTASTPSDNFKIVKNLDIFFSVFRELNLLYVDDIDADKIVKSGIDGMLNELDPYTVFLPEEDVDEFDLATTGEYSGIGAVVGVKNNYIQIVETYKDFPADKAGLVAGDIVLSIDNNSLQGKTTAEASNLLKGEQGTTLNARVIKLKTSDTVNIKLTREKIHISGIAHAGIIRDNVGYIALSSFTQNCQKDFKNVLRELEATKQMKSLIIDLRGNTGGWLEGAIDIVGMFVKKGTEVVYSRGRIKDFDYSYKTKDEPLQPDIPIVVLVNSGSASSSEIVAGALQDLDRAVIAGTRTFGKGLVQTVRQIGYNARIKLTTAKYYIPSGRCIQAHNFSERNEDGSIATIPDSLKKEFNTSRGRKVYDGGGIMPDIEVKTDEFSDIAVSLALRNLISEYAIKYFAKHEHIAEPEDFKITDADYLDFIDFLSDKEYDYQTKVENLVETLSVEIKNEKYSDSIKIQIDALKSQITHNKTKDLQTYKHEISQLINEEIAGKYFYQQGRIRKMLTDDKQLDAAINILLDANKYNEILNKKNL
ncbi:MAG: S41 family peptidase [Prevotellaceae bacterium]|jgi:carboxyl-terminal processing protease|nr:S41 family peptidase [Prevotellaceae bacterium]